MRTLIRYLLFFGVLVGLAFAVVSVEVGGATLYRRYRFDRMWPKTKSWLDATWASWTAPEPRKKPKKARVIAPDRRAKERVAILRDATRRAEVRVKTAPPQKKTRVDPRPSPKQKKALDELVTSRVGRR